MSVESVLEATVTEETAGAATPDPDAEIPPIFQGARTQLPPNFIPPNYGFAHAQSEAQSEQNELHVQLGLLAREKMALVAEKAALELEVRRHRKVARAYLSALVEIVDPPDHLSAPQSLSGSTSVQPRVFGVDGVFGVEDLIRGESQQEFRT